MRVQTGIQQQRQGEGRTRLASWSRSSRGAGPCGWRDTTTQRQAHTSSVCTQSRLPLFGQIADGNMAANRLGAVVEDSWAVIPNHYHNISLDAFVLMPNHAHGVIIIEHGTSGLGAGFKPALPTTMTSKRHGIPEVVRAFKTFSARRINKMRSNAGKPVWQRGFYDHVIRSENELNIVRTYILDNPRKWSEDVDNPANWQGRGRVSNPPLRPESQA